RGRRRRGAAPLQGAGSRGTPLPGVEGPPRGSADLPEEQPSYRRADHRDLFGVAHLLPRRTRSTPGYRARRETRRPLRRSTRQTHRPTHLRSPRPATPDPQPQQRPTNDPPTRTPPEPATRPTQR